MPVVGAQVIPTSWALAMRHRISAMVANLPLGTLRIEWSTSNGACTMPCYPPSVLADSSCISNGFGRSLGTLSFSVQERFIS